MKFALTACTQNH